MAVAPLRPDRDRLGRERVASAAVVDRVEWETFCHSLIAVAVEVAWFCHVDPEPIKGDQSVESFDILRPKFPRGQGQEIRVVDSAGPDGSREGDDRGERRVGDVPVADSTFSFTFAITTAAAVADEELGERRGAGVGVVAVVFFSSLATASLITAAVAAVEDNKDTLVGSRPRPLRRFLPGLIRGVPGFDLDPGVQDRNPFLAVCVELLGDELPHFFERVVSRVQGEVAEAVEVVL